MASVNLACNETLLLFKLADHLSCCVVAYDAAKAGVVAAAADLALAASADHVARAILVRA